MKTNCGNCFKEYERRNDQSGLCPGCRNAAIARVIGLLVFILIALAALLLFIIDKYH